MSQKLADAVMNKVKCFVSPPFFSTFHGYKLCARIYLNGDGQYKGKAASLFVGIMKGPYDVILKWPINAKITMTMIDQVVSSHRVEAFACDPTSNSFNYITQMSSVCVVVLFPYFIIYSYLQRQNLFFETQPLA